MVSPAKDLFGGRRRFPRWRVIAILWRVAPRRMVLVQPNDPPSPAGGNPTLPAAYGPTSLSMDQGDGGGGPLLPVTLRSSGQRSRAGARTKKNAARSSTDPDGRPSDGGRDRR